MTELLYARGTRSADEIQHEIDQFWASLDGSEGLGKELTDAGIDLGAVSEVARRDAIRVDVRGAGVDPTAVTLVVAFAPTANAILISLWTQVLLPRIRDKFGRDAIRDEKPPES
jgi:hypothetical protein